MSRWSKLAVAWMLVCGFAAPSQAQDVAWGKRSCPTPIVIPEYCPPQPAIKGETTKPEQPTQPTQPTTPSGAQDADRAPDISPERFAAGQGEGYAAASTAVGYIDPALPISMVRMRFDTAYRNNRPDRAEYFYPKCGCYMTPDAQGPAPLITNVDYQELRNYLEYAFTQRSSAFIDIPVRFVTYDNFGMQGGLGDIVTGFKYAFQYEQGKITTFQTKIYIPTGSGGRGLGTEHTSIEPGVLFYRQLGRRLGLEGEFKDWIPIGGSNFAGNVLQYGLGLGGTIYDTGCFRIIPITEVVGWTVLNGQQTIVEPNFAGAISADGDTIVNAKFGVRTGFGKLVDNSFISKSDLYVGYGRALTGDVWYKDILRVEFRIAY